MTRRESPFVYVRGFGDASKDWRIAQPITRMIRITVRYPPEIPRSARNDSLSTLDFPLFE